MDVVPLNYGRAELLFSRSFLNYFHLWLCQQFLYIRSTETTISGGDRHTSAQLYSHQGATLMQRTEADTPLHI